jgi:hypothetical protein
VSAAHQIFHVVVLLAFLAALATAFLGFVGPLLFSNQAGLRMPAMRTAFMLLAAAALSLAADWFIHNLNR